LSEELIALGHDVTLFVSGDSRTKGRLVSVIPRAIRLSKPRPEPFPAYAAQLEAIAEAASDFDIVHCHTDWVHMPLLSRLGVPNLTAFHNRLDTPDLEPVMARFPLAPVVSISDHHRTPLPSANWLGTVYHGLPAAALSSGYEPDSYLALSAGSPRRRDPRQQFGLPGRQENDCAWLPKSRALKPAI